MPPKRPVLSQISIEPPPENKGVTITDTLTLVVKGDGGVEMRVKESGIAPGPSLSTPFDSASRGIDTDAVMNKIRFDDLRIGQELGKGSQGKVRIAQHRITGEKYAIKYLVFEGDADDMRQALQSELRQVEALKHKNLVSSYEAFFRDGKLYIVLEFMDAGTMNDVIKRHPKDFKEEMIAYVARELFQGLERLHSSKMIHRDIKPANVLANSSGEVKISDFGVAKTFSGGDLQTLSSQGSVPYMSPERIQSKPYSFVSDVWSAGLTIAECSLGSYPFTSLKSRLFELCQTIASGAAKVNWEGSSCSAELRDFVDRCLLPVETRPSASEMLQHPFLRKADGISPAEAGRWFVTPSV